MQREGLGPLPLAKKMGKPGLQSQIQRFKDGDVQNPARTTAVPLAAYFSIPTDAIYDEKLATAIAKERGIEAPLAPTAPRATGRRGQLDKEAQQMADEFANMNRTQRTQLKRLMDSLIESGKQRTAGK